MLHRAFSRGRGVSEAVRDPVGVHGESPRLGDATVIVHLREDPHRRVDFLEDRFGPIRLAAAREPLREELIEARFSRQRGAAHPVGRLDRLVEEDLRPGELPRLRECLREIGDDLDPRRIVLCEQVVRAPE